MPIHDIPAIRVTYPSRRLGDPKFRYVPAARTDVRRTWRKFRLLARIQANALVAK